MVLLTKSQYKNEESRIKPIQNSLLTCEGCRCVIAGDYGKQINMGPNPYRIASGFWQIREQKAN